MLVFEGVSELMVEAMIMYSSRLLTINLNIFVDRCV